MAGMESPQAPRRAVRPWLIAAGIAVALAVLAWLAVQILLPPARLQRIARAELETVLGREVALESAAVSIFPPVRAHLSGLTVGEASGLASGAALRLESLDLDLDPFALIARRLVLRRVALIEPRLHLVLHADGTTNWDPPARAAAPATSAGAPPFDVAIQSLRIVRGELVVDDERAARRTVIDLDSRISLALAGGSRIATSGSTRLSGLARGPLVPGRAAPLDRGLAKLELVIEHRGTFDAVSHRLALERLAFSLGAATIEFRGVVDGLGSARALANLEAHSDGLDFGTLLDAAAAADVAALHGVSGSGRVSFDLAMTGPLTASHPPAISGQVTVRDAAFRYPGTPAGVSALILDVRVAPDSLNVTNLAARVADQPFHGAVRVTRFQDPVLDFHLTGAADLAALGTLVAPPGARLAGRVTFDVAGSGPARTPADLVLTGSAALEEVRVTSPSLPQPMQHVNGKVEFSRAQAAVHALRAAAGRSSFSLEATVDRPLALLGPVGRVPPARVTFTLDSPYLDLAELLPPTPGPTLLPNAAGSGSVRLGRLKRGPLDVQNVSASVTFDPTSLTVSPFTLAGYGGRIAGTARFDLRDPAHPGFAIKARADSVEADSLLSAWTPAKGLLRGGLHTTIDLSGTGTQPAELARSLTAVGLAAVTSGELGPTPALTSIAKMTGVPSFEKLSFRDLHLPFEVRNGQIATRNVTLHSQAGDWTASGLLGLGGALDYEVGAVIPAEQVAALGADAARAAGALADASGRLHLRFHVSGSAREPRVELDARALGDEVAGRLKGSSIEQQMRRALAPAAGDSAHPLDVQAVAESLKKIKGSDLLKRLFGGGSAAAPRDTGAH